VKNKDSKNIQIKESLIGTLRAIVADEMVQVEFDEVKEDNFFSWNQDLVEKKKNIIVPDFMIQRGIEAKNLVMNGNIRAAADLAACYFLFHDGNLHVEKNYEPEEQKFFDEFEKIRVISEAKNSYLGVVKNILSKIEEDVLSASGNLSMILLREIFADKILPRSKNLALELEKNLNQKILREIKSLAAVTSNQKEFSAKVAQILDLLRKEQESLNEESGKNSSEKSPAQNNSENDLENFGAENSPQKEDQNFNSESEETKKEVPLEAPIDVDLKEDDQSGEVNIKLEKPEEIEAKLEFKNAYKVYSTRFDEVVYPQKLIKKHELELLRDQLDLKLDKLEGISKKMTLKLKRKLLSKRNSILERDSSRGILDRKRLTRLIIDPMIEDLWVSQKNHNYQDTALTILLDNSGSMRGVPIVMSALACEIIAEILEKFAVKTEIIGFTTADWKGGRPKKLWESSGRPINPGRLNELRHIIYKHFNQNFKKAKTNLGLMLKEGILKENIDGEALLFARARLMQRSEKRKILMVISDGTPVDDSTNSVNDKDILTDHLHHVINKIEKGKKIEIVGVGIGHSTDEFYRNSTAIKSIEDLGDAMIQKISELL
jgi:cobaltochelatase CobT